MILRLWRKIMPRLLVRDGKSTHCKTCGLQPQINGNKVRYIVVTAEHGHAMAAEDWEYYCEPCRAIQILSGDNRGAYDLGDF